MYVYRKASEKNHVIHIEGRLDSLYNMMIKLIPELDDIKTSDIMNNERSIQNTIIINIDLSKLEFISEECLRLFQKLKTIYNIKFQNYSLFIEMKFIEYDLLN